MKKLLVTALLAVTVVTSAFSADTKVNRNILSSFKDEFKNVSEVTWSTAAEFTKASFVYDHVRTEAFFLPSGEIIGTSKAITFEELSAKAKKRFAKNFDGYVVTEAIRFDTPDEGACYLSAKNEKETVVVKVSDTDGLTIVKRTKI
jgi:hypothetical protein